MKKIWLLAGFTLTASLFVLALSLGEFLALHDIRQEYVSEEIIDSLEVSLSAELPGWTATKGEWALVQFSYVARFAFLALNGITLSLLVMILRRQDRESQQPT
ncbi:MAG: hypothetical protein ACE5JF_06900 [Anaerolineales bacterium]